jgi:Ca-activated chloride channel homolog
MAAPLRAALIALLLIAMGSPRAPAGSGAPAPGEPARRHLAWLEEVEILITEEERQAFLELSHDWQRELFIREFWRARERSVPGAGRLQDQWRQRVEEARSRFEDLADDRARLLLLHGPPARVLEGRCGGLLRPLEVWIVPPGLLFRDSLVLAFYQPQGRRDGRYELWEPTLGLQSLALMVHSAAGSGADSLTEEIRRQCFRGDELLGALSGAVGWAALEAAGASSPRPNPEWLPTFLARSTELPDEAPRLAAHLEVSFPGRHQNRTVVEGVLVVEGEALGKPSPPRDAHAFFVDGVVLRQGELFESFRYRFEVPVGEAPADEVPLVLQRHLRPGTYRLVLRLEELHRGRFFRHEGELEVPLVARGGALLPGQAAALAALPGEGVPEALAAAEEVVVRLHPPPPELLTGTVRVGAEVRGAEVARVRFELDGREVLSRASAPYEATLNLGRSPRVRTVRAVALDGDGAELAADEVSLNAGPHRFAVRLREPLPGVADREERLRAWAEVQLPPWEQLDRVELFLDETLLATLYQPPFVQHLTAPAGEDPSYVRAVAHLEGGAVAEDLVFLFAPDHLDQVDVRLVELYTTVVDRRGRPHTGLERAAFQVREDGREQHLLRFEWVENLPVHAGIVLDTSTSMAPILREAEQAALGFFEKLLTERDRACLITFDDAPRLVVPFTNRAEVLAGGLAGLTAQGWTALWDSIIYSLHYFGGIQGRRVLLLISDGEDSSSSYRFDDALELARRSGVTIFSIGLGLPRDAVQVRSALERLSRETGGRVFFVQRVQELPGVYQQIDEELRSQYLLAYQTDARDPERFRQVEVEVAAPGLTARTVRGYYP